MSEQATDIANLKIEDLKILCRIRGLTESYRVKSDLITRLNSIGVTHIENITTEDDNVFEFAVIKVTTKATVAIIVKIPTVKRKTNIHKTNRGRI